MPKFESYVQGTPSYAELVTPDQAAAIGTVRANEPGTPIWNELISLDLPGATTFYADVLGVAWEKQEMEGGMDYTCLLVDGRQVAGAMPPMMEGIPPHWNVYFNVESVDDTVARAPQGATFNLMSS